MGEAVSGGVINNETLAYFMCRTYDFLLRVGIDKDRIRFRQHLPTGAFADVHWRPKASTGVAWNVAAFVRREVRVAVAVADASKG